MHLPDCQRWDSQCGNSGQSQAATTTILQRYVSIDAVDLAGKWQLWDKHKSDLRVYSSALIIPKYIMAKSREKIQQLGFWDAEITKPDHDAVCLWAYNNADFIFRTVYPERLDQPWSHIYKDQSTDEMAKTFTNANPRPAPRIFKKTLEYVLKKRTGYNNNIEQIVGYADLMLEIESPQLHPIYKKLATNYDEDEIAGFELGWSPDGRESRILIEAKSVLPTVGELMRQVQLYRTAFSGKFVVVSPDDSYAQILNEQGVTFIQCTLGAGGAGAR